VLSRASSGYSALSRGRYSVAGEEYFLTFNLQRPQSGLCQPALLTRLLAALRTSETDGAWATRTAVVMPDHLHLLVRLGGRVPLGEAVRRYKGRLTVALREYGLCWQRSFFDHRLRHGEDCLPVFLYIFLNAYRAGLVKIGERWPGYYCASDDWEWFGSLAENGVPFPEWLAGR
jgi:putative transposase